MRDATASPVPRLRIVFGPGAVFGPGKDDLPERIARTGGAVLIDPGCQCAARGAALRGAEGFSGGKQRLTGGFRR